MSIFYTLAQVNLHISENDSFSPGDRFIMAVKWIRYEMYINSNWVLTTQQRAETLAFICWDDGYEKQYNFLLSALESLNLSDREKSNLHWINIFWGFNTKYTNLITIEIFNNYNKLRKKYYKKFVDSASANKGWYLELNPKFYWELEFAPKRSAYTFWDWTSYINEDVVDLLDLGEDNCFSPIFSQCYQYSGIDWKKIYFRDEQSQISIRTAVWIIKIPSSFLNEIDVVNINWDNYEKKHFLKSVWKFSKVLNRYYVGSGELSPSDELKWYHSDHYNVVVRADEESTMYFGIELEKRYEMVSANYKKLAKDWWRCERDSSCGAEYISPVLSLDNYEESISFIKDTAQDILDWEISSNCGWHIHISVRWVDIDELYRRCAIFLPLLWAMYPARATNSYSQRPTSNVLAHWCRRDFVKKPEIGTVEFRIFPGCQWERMLRFRLGLLKLIISQSLVFDKEASFNDALEFIMKSKEMFEMISYVYNTSEKMQGISSRIESAYKSVGWIPSGINVSSILIENVAEFVASKKEIRIEVDTEEDERFTI